MSTEPLTPEQIEELKKRHIRSFCMRRGHISNAHHRAKAHCCQAGRTASTV